MLTVENVFKDKSLFSISGNVHLHEGASTADLDNATPVNIIQTDQNLFVHFVFTQSGWLSKMMNGRYQCRVFLELMGAGEAPNPAPSWVNFVPVDGHTYSAVVTIPRNTLREGVYKVIATVHLDGISGKPTPIAAYDEIGVLQVYND
ncbi:MAG: hypothetical protein DHS20C18_34950 [Saprospiraceae bacterium]|nr:MAG: hypothetical protein DHS20C18_34950 [Saprospiraceae bacterium]